MYTIHGALVSIWHLGYHCKGRGMYTIHLATCQHLVPRLSLQRLGYVHYPFDHLSASGTFAITAKVGVCTLSIWPFVSIWYLGYHCKGWGMYTIYLATCQHLAPKLLLQRLGYAHYLFGHLSASGT